MEHTYKIGGMDCLHCAQTVEKGVSSLPGVTAAEVDFTTATLKIDGVIDAEALRDRVKALGYSLENPASAQAILTAPTRGGIVGFARFLLKGTTSRYALAGGAILLLGFILSIFGVSVTITTAVFLLATGIALLPLARSGINNLIINRDFNINLLMTIAAIGAALIGETPEAATVVFLFTIGESLEGYTTERARESIRSLMTLVPPTALVRRADGEQVMPVDQLAVGDVIVVKPGERVPMDGVILAGESSLNQAPVTGESVPVYKSVGAEVFAGTVNGLGALDVRVTRLAADNTIARIIRMVEEAQSVRAPSQTLVDQFARVYTPAIVVIAALVAFVPPILFSAPFYDLPDGTHGWLYRALALLVIACPCALVISTPVTVISAITAAARRGVLIKGGVHLETLAQIKAVAFDKTGTLTRGQPVVTQTRAANETHTEPHCPTCDDVLALANAVETRSTHPLARAVTEAAVERGVATAYAPAERVESLAGRGIQGRVNGRLITVGSHALFDEVYPHNRDLCAQISAAEAGGSTTMLVADGDTVRGYISVADAVRAESAAVIRDLRALGQRTVMLTGDNATVAHAVGERLGVDDVRADLLPADKLNAVGDLLAQYGKIAMIGDGINDTPALARASVGVAMGGAGSAQALETADVALMGDDLTGLPFVIKLARFARRLIAQNIVASFALKAVFVLLALFGATTLWVAVFADVGMLLVVTLNGMRPLRGNSSLR
ncbi:MAG: heavy metal translocating P-type ATPase [Anaerolinea sp.]|nr:heavy metal translocating P-type ATPase [Anaerolinea sp.]